MTARHVITLAAAIPAICLVLGAGLVHAAGNDWMSSLDGLLPLTRLTIPGTHDSGARYEPLAGTAKCQTLSITGQLDAGIRFLDIRCRHLKDGFTIHHGPIYQNISFADVLGELKDFLHANPRETVIMSVKEESAASGNTRSFEATFDAYVARNPEQWLLGEHPVTLDASRGKIVLFRRFGAASTPKGIDATHWPDNATFGIDGRMRVQDRYVVRDNQAKWSFIEAVLNEARQGDANTLYVNCCSGYQNIGWGIPNITIVSNNINPRLITYFAANPSGRFGIVLMDFATADLVGTIYKTNLPGGSEHRLPIRGTQ